MAVPIRIESLTKAFGGHVVLRGITLNIEAGELFFLLGPSGCGKTTLLRAVAGLNDPDGGHIWAGDRDVTHLPPHKRDMGMVFQSYALWPHMTLRENVAFGLEMRHVGRDEKNRRVMEALEQVRLADRADAKPNELSGGQQQRVALARALVIKPQCLLLDEPLSNLDAKLRLDMRTEIRRICKEAGLTAIYVTHDQKEALSIADRLAVLDEGTLLQVGAPQDVYSNPNSKFVAQFIGETTFLDGVVSAIREEGRLVVKTASGDWVGQGAKPFSIGDSVAVSVRPEMLQLHTERTDGDNIFSGVLHGTIYLGEMAQHAFTLSDGTELKSFEMRPQIVARDHSVETRAYVDPANVRILAAE